MSSRQKIMFVFFAIALAYVLFMTAMLQNLNVISGNFSLLIFLLALYLDRTYQSKSILVLAVAIIIVNYFIGIVAKPASMFTIDSLLNVIFFMGLYFFSNNFFKDNFFKNKENLLVLLLVLPILIYKVFFVISTTFVRDFSFFGLLYLLTLIIDIFIPVAVILYSYLRIKENQI